MSLRPGQVLECVRCGEPFVYRTGKPGKARECEACAEDVEVVVAADCSADDPTDFILIPAHLKPRFHTQLSFALRTPEGAVATFHGREVTL